MKHPLFHAFALAGLAVALATGNTFAAPQFRTQAQVPGEVITFGDLIEGMEKGADLPVFAAPQPGKSGVIRIGRVQAALREMGLPVVPGESTASITVSRASRALTPELMREALRARLGLEAPGTRFEILFDGYIEARHLEAGLEGALMVRTLSRDPRSGRFEAELGVEGVAAGWRLAGQAIEMREVFVLARDLERLEPLRESDFTRALRPAASAGTDALGTTSEIIGMIPKRVLKSGEVIRQADLSRPVLVEKNQLVSVTYSSGGLTLSLRGRAQNSAARGESVQVLNMQSKRMIEGVVTGPGQVQVQPGAGAVVPLAQIDPNQR